MKTRKMKIQTILMLVILTLVFMACAESQSVSECIEGKTYGFWSGLWHGIIAPITFVISLFKDEVAMYAINNNGAWYNFGFLIGAVCIAGGSSKASCSKKRKG